MTRKQTTEQRLAADLEELRQRHRHLVQVVRAYLEIKPYRMGGEHRSLKTWFAKADAAREKVREAVEGEGA